jgi:hypothetical protein
MQLLVGACVYNGFWLVDHILATDTQVLIDIWGLHLLNSTRTGELLPNPAVICGRIA